MHRFKQWIDDKFVVETGRKRIYIWRSRVFEEMSFVYFPRLLFLTGSCYFIYLITLKHHMNQRTRHAVRSHRQEKVDK